MWLLGALIVGSIVSVSSKTVNDQASALCSEQRAEVPTLICKCSEFTTTFQPYVDDYPIFTNIEQVHISDCDSADLHLSTFYAAKNLTLINIQRIKNLTLDAVLPKSLRTLQLTDIGYINEIQETIFTNDPNISDIKINNAIIQNIRPHTFNFVTISRVSFINVTFLNLPGDSLAFTFDVNSEPKLTFDSCTFDRIETNPYSISTNITNIVFTDNVLNCATIEDEVIWIAKLFENLEKEKGSGLCCETLSSNYCDKKKDYEDEMIYKLFTRSNSTDKARLTCPDLFDDYYNYTINRPFDSNSAHNIQFKLYVYICLSIFQFIVILYLVML